LLNFNLKTLTFAEIQTLSLSQKVQAVEEAFSLLHQEMANFQGWSGLTCKSGCGKCCSKPDIEATVLEFLPFALHLYQTHQSEEWLGKLSTEPGKVCLFFNPTAPGLGSCSQYSHRGLICRLFGYSARTNKYGQREFVTCQTIKTEQPEAYTATVEKVRAGSDIPVMNHHYMRLHSIDPSLARDFYPINEAIRRAIETVLHYYAYRD
jgi:Fe-S-cluster containining protein